MEDISIFPVKAYTIQVLFFAEHHAMGKNDA